MVKSSSLVLGAGILAALGLTGMRGGCAATSMSPAPLMDGEWDVTYEDTFAVEIAIGGSIYTEELGAAGGVIQLTHEGEPIEFNLDCSNPDILCPSEVMPEVVTADQRQYEEFPNRVWIEVTETTCDGETVEADPAECGEGTLNPDCNPVCDGEISPATTETFGLIDEEGENFGVFLGASVATNGTNCALLGVSAANAELTSTGSAETDDWEASSMSGDLVVGYAGGCLWVVRDDVTEEYAGAVIGATISVRSPFTAQRRPSR